MSAGRITTRRQALRAGARRGTLDASSADELVDLAEREGVGYALDAWLSETLDAVSVAAELARVPARWRRVWERAYIRAAQASDRRHLRAEGLL